MMTSKYIGFIDHAHTHIHTQKHTHTNTWYAQIINKILDLECQGTDVQDLASAVVRAATSTLTCILNGFHYNIIVH